MLASVLCSCPASAADPADIEQAQKLIDLGRLPDAAILLDSILASAPTSERAWLLRARVHKQEGKTEQARQAMARALEIAPDSVDALNDQAIQQLADNDVAGALTSFERGLTVQPGNSDSLVGRAFCRHRQGQFEAAIADYSQCLKLKPREHSLWEMRGDSYSALKKWQEARDDYTKSLRIHSGSAKVWLSRGQAHLQLHDQRSAVGDFSAAIELAPTDALLWSERAGAYIQLGNWDYARRDSDRAIFLDPKYMDGWALRGMAHARLSQPEEALKDFDEAIGLQKDPQVLLERSRLHGSLGHWPAAQGDLEETTRIDIANSDAWNELGVAHLRQGHWEDAKMAYSQAIKLHDQNSMYMRNRAALAAERGDLKSAAADYTLCLAIPSAELEDHWEAALVANHLHDDKALSTIARQAEDRFAAVASSAEVSTLAMIRLLSAGDDQRLQASAAQLSELAEKDHSSYETLVLGLVHLGRKDDRAALAVLSTFPESAPIAERSLVAFARAIAQQRSGQSDSAKGQFSAGRQLLDQIKPPAADSQSGVRLVWQDRFVTEWLSEQAAAALKQ